MIYPVKYKEIIAAYWGVSLPSGPEITLIDDTTEMITRYDDKWLEIKDYPGSHYPCNAQFYRTKKAPGVMVGGVKYFAYSIEGE